MEVFWFLSLSCLAVTAFEFEYNDTRINGENGWYVPLANGSWKWVDETEEFNMISARSKSRSVNPVKFLLYTKSNPDSPQKITASVESINNSNFNSTYRTKFVIHGWVQTHHANMNEELRNASFRTGACNFIFVEWARAKSGYVTAFKAVPDVGKQVAEFIDFLVKACGMPLDSLYVIGHSLGAQIAGFTGKHVNTGKIHAIVGLDPARPLYKYNKPDKRLNSTDAFYVESIQTNGGKLGFKQPIGTATFYPNGGQFQPDCNVDITGICSHRRSVVYYTEAITEVTFGSIQCESYENALNKDCGDHLSTVRMRAIENAFIAKGSYYVPIKKEFHQFN